MKTSTLLTLATIAGLATFAGSAAAENQRSYTCRSGAVTITSLSPCYVTTYGISVPGDHGLGENNKDGKGDGPNGKKGGGIDGPKDLKDKPKGGGFNGPKNIKDKD